MNACLSREYNLRLYIDTDTKDTLSADREKHTVN